MILASVKKITFHAISDCICCEKFSIDILKDPRAINFTEVFNDENYIVLGRQIHWF
jgi:hypothetical protein